MNRTARCVFLVVASLLCASCQRGAIEPSESLVGADDPPNSGILSQEIIQLNRGFGAYSSGNFLSYELRPDNSLTITHTFRPKDEVRGVETFRLPAVTAEHARRMLWRVRPANLAGVESETRPMGCQQQGPHDLGELAVVFIKEGDKAGIQHDKLGTFVLPSPESCDSRDAIEARKLVQQVLQSFPPSKVAAEFSKPD